MSLPRPGALDDVEFDDIRQHVHELFLETVQSTLSLQILGPGSTQDDDFGHFTASDTQDFELHYTNILSSGLKLSGIEDADFNAISHNRVYLSAIEIEQTIPGGRIKREEHTVLLNGKVWQIEAIVPYPMQHNKAIIIKLHLTDLRPAEQDQGTDGD